MPGTVTVRLSGFRETERALAELGKRAGKDVLRRVGRQALKPVLDTAKLLVPVDEGDLRDSLVISTRLSRSAARNARGDPRDTVTVRMGTTNRNGVPREFGSIRSPAEPFIRPAWELNKQGVLQFVTRELDREIVKTRGRQLARAARLAEADE